MTVSLNICLPNTHPKCLHNINQKITNVITKKGAEKMSFPNIPNIIPEIDISTEEAVNLLLASIAFEELGLAHIINAEAEKIQFVLGTLHNQTTSLATTIEDLIKIDTSVVHTLRTVIKQQMLLQFKLEDVLSISTFSTTTFTTTHTTTCTTTCYCG